MAIKIVIANLVTFSVSGKLNDEGVDQAFDFQLTARRLLADELQTTINDNERTLPQVLGSIVTGWDRVLDADGDPVSFSKERFAQLLQIPGLCNQIFKTYLAEVGTKEKN